jgi:hypothetical protein
VRKSAAELDAWHGGGRLGSRPPGRLRNHVTGIEGGLPVRHRWFTAPVYRSFLDPDGRPLVCDYGGRTDSEEIPAQRMPSNPTIRWAGPRSEALSR